MGGKAIYVVEVNEWVILTVDCNLDPILTWFFPVRLIVCFGVSK